MPDLLVKLYELPNKRPNLAKGIIVRPVMAAEISIMRDWIEKNFSRGWADEFERGAHASPVGSLIAVEDRTPLGFACYDATAIGLFGPTGVDSAQRGKGIGSALLFATLDAMKAKGHVYAVIGWAGPVDYYEKIVGASVIEGSETRYANTLLKQPK
ncbi:MAG: GNAT family N-acetyltransferase [Hyphomicrobiales bacterium]